MDDALPRVDRGFVRIAEGQVHYRESGRENAARPPLVLLHASPGSALMLQPLLRELGRRRHALAADTLGNGDSAAPAGGDPSIAYFARAHLRALDALGVEHFDLYGSHTGANIACEIALEAPQRVRRLILDGVSLYSAQERADMLRHYAPEISLDQSGTQLHAVWHFVRDVYLFWPWYRRDAAHRRDVGLPSAGDLHDKVVEVLKAVRTYHLPYRAAIAYDKVPRLPLLAIPILLACARNDMFMQYFDAVRELVPAAATVITEGVGSPQALVATAGTFSDFLDAEPSWGRSP